MATGSSCLSGTASGARDPTEVNRMIQQVDEHCSGVPAGSRQIA